MGDDFDGIGPGKRPPNSNRQALPTELVQNIEYPKRPAMMGLEVHDLISPDMIGPG